VVNILNRQIHLNKAWVPNRKFGAERIFYVSRLLWTHGFKRVAYVLKFINTLVFRTFIPPEVVIGERLDLPHGGFGVVIHGDTVIGDDAIIFHNVTIGNGGARIGDRVYIGTGATLIGRIKIGNDVSIGAGAIVNFDVPDGSTVVGPLGRIIDAPP
jgi:serine O-acetyltransferase